MARELSNGYILPEQGDSSQVVFDSLAHNIILSNDRISSSGGGTSSLTIQEDGVNLPTPAHALNFTGDGITASGASSTKTINVPGLQVKVNNNPLTQTQRLIFTGSDFSASIQGQEITIALSPEVSNNIAVESSGSPVGAAATTLNFTGDAVTVSGDGAVKEIAINHSPPGQTLSLATDAETIAGTNTTKATTPAGVKAARTAANVTVDASEFGVNLKTTDNTVQKVADAVNKLRLQTTLRAVDIGTDYGNFVQNLDSSDTNVEKALEHLDHFISPVYLSQIPHEKYIHEGQQIILNTRVGPVGRDFDDLSQADVAGFMAARITPQVAINQIEGSPRHAKAPVVNAAIAKALIGQISFDKDRDCEVYNNYNDNAYFKFETFANSSDPYTAVSICGQSTAAGTAGNGIRLTEIVFRNRGGWAEYWVWVNPVTNQRKVDDVRSGNIGSVALSDTSGPLSQGDWWGYINSLHDDVAINTIRGNLLHLYASQHSTARGSSSISMPSGVVLRGFMVQNDRNQLRVTVLISGYSFTDDIVVDFNEGHTLTLHRLTPQSGDTIFAFQSDPLPTSGYVALQLYHLDGSRQFQNDIKLRLKKNITDTVTPGHFEERTNDARFYPAQEVIFPAGTKLEKTRDYWRSVRSADSDVGVDNLPSATLNNNVIIPVIEKSGTTYSHKKVTGGQLGDSLNIEDFAKKNNTTQVPLAKVPNIPNSKLPVLDASKIPTLDNSKLPATIDASRIPDLNANKINEGTLSVDRLPFRFLTQTAYNAIANKDNNTLYFITN